MNKKLKEILIGLLILFFTLVIFFGVGEIILRLIYGHSLIYSYGGSTLWSLQPNQKGFTIPNHKIAHINSYGLRGEEFSVAKEEGVFRILMLGSSYVFGYGLSDNETLPFQLQELLNDRIIGKKFEVINGGVPGYGIFQMINFYKEKGTQYNPDLIVLVSTEEHLLRQPPEEKKDFKYYLRRVARFSLRKSVFAAIMKPRLKRIRWVLFGNLEELEEEYDEFWNDDKGRLGDFANILLNEDKSLVLVPYIENESELGFLEKMRDFASSYENVFVVDNVYERREEFGRLNNKELLQITKDEHPTAIADQITAQLIYEKLINSSLIH